MSNISAVKTLEKPQLSLKAKTVYAIAAIAGAVVLPQFSQASIQAFSALPFSLYLFPLLFTVLKI